MANIDEIALINEMYKLVTDKEYYLQAAKLAAEVEQQTWEQTALQFISTIEKYAK